MSSMWMLKHVVHIVITVPDGLNTFCTYAVCCWNAYGVFGGKILPTPQSPPRQVDQSKRLEGDMGKCALEGEWVKCWGWCVMCRITRILSKVKESYPCSRPWRPIGLWGIKAPTFCRHSAHRWQWGCQPHAPATLYPQEDSWYSFLLEAKSTPGP
jgi:hypothetical protein